MQKSGAWHDFIISMSRVTQEKMANYGKVVDLLSEKRHEWNIELFFIKVCLEVSILLFMGTYVAQHSIATSLTNKSQLQQWILY